MRGFICWRINLWRLSGVCEFLFQYFWKYRFVLDLENMTPSHLDAKTCHFLLFDSLIKKLSNGWFWMLNGVELKFVEIYISQLLTLQRLTNFRSHMKRRIGISKTILRLHQKYSYSMFRERICLEILATCANPWTSRAHGLYLQSRTYKIFELCLIFFS